MNVKPCLSAKSTLSKGAQGSLPSASSHRNPTRLVASVAECALCFYNEQRNVEAVDVAVG